MVEHKTEHKVDHSQHHPSNTHSDSTNKEKDSIVLTKKTLIYGIISIIVIALIVFYFASYLPKANQNKLINEYKKAVYDSILCQHECPIALRTIQNTTAFLPDPNCIKTCTVPIKILNLTGNEFTPKELLKDNLFSDMSKVLEGCKSSTQDPLDPTNVNYSTFFPCVASGISEIKTNATYAYLK